jgi:hypothetical protein
MNAQQLYIAKGDIFQPVKAYYCSECRIVKRTQEEAEKCCVPHRCDTCGAELERYRTRCDKCRDKFRQARLAEMLERAEKLESWDGWVYYENAGYQDGYFQSVDDLIEWLADNVDFESDWPEYVFVCKGRFDGIRLDRVLEDIEQDMYEDVRNDLHGIPELEAAINAFNTANVGVLTYEPDYSKAVRVLNSELHWDLKRAEASRIFEAAHGDAPVQD